MAIILNTSAFDHAKEFIEENRDVVDQRGDWSKDEPSAQEGNKFIKDHGFSEYGKWYLGINDQKPEGTKERYEFPYGDFSKVHRCGLLAVESRAGQYKHFEIENAAKQLLQMMGK
jgi:hypothetical protein